MTGMIVAFSGGIGSGKSTLTRDLANELRWPRVSFGDYVRQEARKAGRDPDDRAVLQTLGQALVHTDPHKFVEGVLGMADQGLDPETSLIVDGIRHAEILVVLKLVARPRPVRLFHLRADATIRQQRVINRTNLEPRVVARYDSDITEAQIARILPNYADKVLDGELPPSFLVNQVRTLIGFKSPEAQLA